MLVVRLTRDRVREEAERLGLDGPIPGRELDATGVFERAAALARQLDLEFGWNDHHLDVGTHGADAAVLGLAGGGRTAELQFLVGPPLDDPGIGWNPALRAWVTDGTDHPSPAAQLLIRVLRAAGRLA